MGTAQSNTNFCGTRSYVVEDTSGNAISWMSVALQSGSTYRITAAPSGSVTAQTYNYRLKINSSNYSSDQTPVVVNFDVVVVCYVSSFTNPSASDRTYNINTG